MLSVPLRLISNRQAHLLTLQLQVSFYSHWGLNNPAEGVLDFEGFRGYQTFLDACVTAGLYVIARPGPYINAEVRSLFPV